MTTRHHSRIYHELADEFPAMYDSADLAGYVRLLVAADQAWPSMARWAGYVDALTMARLVKTGLVIPEGEARYTIKGLEKERAERRAIGAHAANVRWSNAPSNADSSAGTNASIVKHSKAQHSTAKADAGRAYYDLKGRQVGRGALAFIDELVADFGDDAVTRQLGIEAQASAIDREFLTRVKGRLILEARDRNRDAEIARKRAEADYQRKMREGRDAMTDEQQAKADSALAKVGQLVRGLG